MCRQRLGGPGDLLQITGSGQGASEQCRHPRGQVGFACQFRVERLEALGRFEQQRRGVAAQPGGEHDLPAQQVGPGALELAQRPRLDHDQQFLGKIEGACLQAGLRGRQRALHAEGRVSGERHRPAQERGGRGQAAAGLGPVRRAFELGRDLLVGPDRRLGAVPGAAIGIHPGIGDLGQRPVEVVPVLDRGRTVGRGANQQMPEPHPLAEFHQPGHLGGLVRPFRDTQPSGRPPHECRIAGRIGRGQLQHRRV